MASAAHVLIIDDDPHIRELLRYALETEGLGVLEAQDGREGLDKALAERPQLLILDIMMPEMGWMYVGNCERHPMSLSCSCRPGIRKSIKSLDLSWVGMIMSQNLLAPES